MLTDGGSTKRDVVAAARDSLGLKLMQFVPAHPVAGAELSGVEAASAELFRERTVVLTPVAETRDDARAPGGCCLARMRSAHCGDVGRSATTRCSRQ